MLFREHKGSLEESMKTVVEIENRKELANHITGLLQPFGIQVSSDTIKIKQYGHDVRIGWDTYIVTLDGYGVLGFTNGACD